MKSKRGSDIICDLIVGPGPAADQMAVPGVSASAAAAGSSGGSGAGPPAFLAPPAPTTQASLEIVGRQKVPAPVPTQSSYLPLLPLALVLSKCSCTEWVAEQEKQKNNTKI